MAELSYTFTSGYTVRVRRVAPETMVRIQAQIATDLPYPDPPRQTVLTPDGEIDAPNPAEPGYRAACADVDQARAVEFGRRVMRLLELFALEYEVDAAQVQAYRETMRAIGTPVDDLNDAQVYLWCLAAVDPVKDQQGVVSFITGMSAPTGAAIAEQAATF